MGGRGSSSGRRRGPERIVMGIEVDGQYFSGNNAAALAAYSLGMGGNSKKVLDSLKAKGTATINGKKVKYRYLDDF